jgi:hypothetical protein
MSRALSELTLNELLAALIAGEAVRLADGSELELPNPDSRALLSFYEKDRATYWNPDKDAQIREGEVDALLKALGKAPAGSASAQSPVLALNRWKLIKLEAHRFRGLHRHCGPNGEDPEVFEQTLDSDVSIFRGFNGAGKTSLLSAVCWCLTGLGYRAQALPAPLHEPIPVFVSEVNELAQPTPTSFNIPPLVPIPSDAELSFLGGKPKADTWVRLTFQSLDEPSRIATVGRTLSRDARGNFKVTTVGLDELGLSELAIHAAVVMPAVVASMRFDDKTTLSQAVSVLTGLRPLARFGERCVRLHDRLSGKYRQEAASARDEEAGNTRSRITTLRDLLLVNPSVPPLEMIHEPDVESPGAWREGILTAKRKLEDAQAGVKADARAVLSPIPSLSTDAAVQGFLRSLDAADSMFSNASLRSLASMQSAVRLGSLLNEDFVEAESQIVSVVREARKVADGLTDARRSNRMRLYSLVARWYEEHHPGERISACPVCGMELCDGLDVPHDAILDLSIADALESCRSADAAATKTAAEWERDRVREFCASLPEKMRSFAFEDLPDNLIDLYGKAITQELFSADDMPQSLRGLSRNAAALWSSVTVTAPATADAFFVELPKVFSGGHDKDGLQRCLNRVERAIRLAKYRAEHSEFIQQAIKRTVSDVVGDGEVAVAKRSLREQVTVLRRFAQSESAFVSVRRQVEQIEKGCESWLQLCARLSALERAAVAIEPFRRFPELVRNQVDGLIHQLNGCALSWASLIYKAQFIGSPSYVGVSPSEMKAFNLLVASGRHVVSAQHVMNASALRAFLWAFVLALWERMWSTVGGVTCMLMDDVQEHLDPTNAANLAAAVPKMMKAGLNPLLASNDFSFLSSVDACVRATKAAGGRDFKIFAWEFSAISQSKLTVSMSPLLDEIKEREAVWRRTDENDPELARRFVNPVRIRVEIKLWDLLGRDPFVWQKPTLGDFLLRIANARKNGEVPFNEEPFRALVEMPCLQPTAEFRRVINKAHHHEAEQLTPVEAKIVQASYVAVLSAIDACWNAYARFMRRLPAPNEFVAGEKTPSAPSVIKFSKPLLPLVGKLAAHGSGTALVDVDDAISVFNLEDLGDSSLFTLRANTLGVTALPGQTLIVSVDEEVRHGDLAVVQTGSNVFARRIGIDRQDPSRIALESLQSITKAPPTHFVVRAVSRMNKITGVVFDAAIRDRSSSGEVVPLETSSVLSQVKAVAKVVGDSAFPVVRDGQHVLVGDPVDFESVSSLIGRIVAVVAEGDTGASERHGFLKRLGKPMPGMKGIYYLENVGQAGEGEYVQFPGRGVERVAAIPAVVKCWKVLGVVFR